jgi:hypothetical protein
MAEVTVGAVLITVLVVGGFGYFIYRRVKAAKERKASTTYGSGGGGGGIGPGGGGNVNQV